MVDFYSQRLQEKQQAKEARRQPNMPLQRPNTMNGVGDSGRGMTMAGKPSALNQESSPQDSLFKTYFDKYTGDPSFKQGMEEFATIMQSMRQDLGGIELPPEVLQKRVQEVVNGYRDKAIMAGQVKNQMAGALDQQMQQVSNEGQMNG